MTYGDDDIDAALDRLDADVTRRSAQPEFHAPAMVALVAELRQMEAARRSGDLPQAARFAAAALPGLEGYRPTNATSRAKALLAEVALALTAS